MEDRDISEMLSKTETARKTDEILLVLDHNLTQWRKDPSGNWEKIFDTYCGYGKCGMSRDRHEGDMTSPVGAFPILFAFGTADSPKTSMTYRKITPYSYWSDEPDTYNTWVESEEKISGEHLIDYYQYEYAMAVGFNQDPAVCGRGSAIFFHCRSTDHWYTAGCISVTREDMIQIYAASHDGEYIIILPDAQGLGSV